MTHFVMQPISALAPASQRTLAAPQLLNFVPGLDGGRYYLVDTLNKFDDFIEQALQQHTIAVDTETSGLDWVRDDVCGISIGWGVEFNYYIPINHKTNEKQLEIDAIRPKLKQLLENTNLTTIWANAKFDLKGLRKLGIEVTGKIHDIIISAHLLDENESHSLKDMAVRMLNPKADKWEKFIKKWRHEERKRRRAEFQDLAKTEIDKGIKEAKSKALIKLTVDEVKVLRANLKVQAKEKFKDLLCAKNNIDQISYDYILLKYMTPYACSDVHYTYLLHKQLLPPVWDHPSLKSLYINELQLLRVLFEMECSGISIDVDYLKGLEPEFIAESDKLKKEVFESIGYEFNLASNQQLIEALQKAGCTLTKLTKSVKKDEAFKKVIVKRDDDDDEEDDDEEIKKPQFAVDKEVLENLAVQYPFADKISKFRKFEKRKNTYLYGICEAVDKHNVLHPNFNQNVSTGRLSSTGVNCHNIESRDKTIRKAFMVPDDNYIFVFIDLSQIELRLTADRSQDPALLACYPFEGLGQDVHTLTLAEVILNRPLDEVKAMEHDKTGHLDKPKLGEICQCQYCDYNFYRTAAKRVNFGIVYGAGAGAIQRQVSTPVRKISKDECQQYIDSYLTKYSGVRTWIDQTEAVIKKYGYVQNTFGRYRRLPIPKNTPKWQVQRLCRQGVNFTIQSEAADLFKTSTVRIANLLKQHKAKTRIVNNVHDELQFYWHKKELGLLKEVKAAMEDFKYRVPIVAEVSYAPHDWSQKVALKI